MPADRRLFESSSMTPPPAPEIDAMTGNVADDGIIYITKGVDVAQGYDPTIPEPAPQPLLARLQALREADRAASTPPTDSVDEILHHIRLHGEAIIRFAGDKYRVTFDAAGNVRSERLDDADTDPFVARYASALAQNMVGDVGFKPRFTGAAKHAYDKFSKDRSR
jgi:hypothetical protein